MTEKDRIKAELKDRIIDLANEYSALLSIEEVAAIYADQGCAVLNCLAWKPHSQRAAYEHFVTALACVRDGRVIPMPHFELLFPEHCDQRVLRTVLLDPYLIKAISEVTPERLYSALRAMYAEEWSIPSEINALSDLAEWLQMARRSPGRAFSTGRTKSFRGITTCALLQVLGVPAPRAARNRHALARAIFDSPEGSRILGDDVPALASARDHTTAR